MSVAATPSVLPPTAHAQPYWGQRSELCATADGVRWSRRVPGAALRYCHVAARSTVAAWHGHARGSLSVTPSPSREHTTSVLRLQAMTVRRSGLSRRCPSRFAPSVVRFASAMNGHIRAAVAPGLLDAAASCASARPTGSALAAARELLFAEAAQCQWARISLFFGKYFSRCVPNRDPQRNTTCHYATGKHAGESLSPFCHLYKPKTWLW